MFLLSSIEFNMIKLLDILFISKLLAWIIISKKNIATSRLKDVFQLLDHFLYTNISSINKYFETFCACFLKTVTLSLKFLDPCFLLIFMNIFILLYLFSSCFTCFYFILFFILFYLRLLLFTNYFISFLSLLYLLLLVLIMLMTL